MNLRLLKTTVLQLATAFALCAGGKLCAAQILLLTLPQPLSLEAQLWSEYSAIIGTSDQLYSAHGATPAWNTASAIYNCDGLTSLGYTGNYGYYDGGTGTNDFDIPFTALTPRHIYLRGHDTGLTNGQLATATGRTQVRFVTRENRIITNTLTALCRPSIGDSTIGLLASNLPPSVEIMTLASPAFLNSINGGAYQFWPPAFNPILGTCNHGYIGTPFHTSTFTHGMFVSGDSGSPNFYIYQKKLVMISGRTTSGYSPEMQTAVDRLTLSAGENTNSFQIKLQL